MNIYPWQLDLLDKMTKYKGRGVVQMTGRQLGKSAFSAQALQRLWDDMLNRPVENLILSTGTVYGFEYYTVEPVGGNWREMEDWATKTFGPVSDVWKADKWVPEPKARWYMNDRKFWFLNEADRTMFVMKWR